MYRIIAVLISINGAIIAMEKGKQRELDPERIHDEWFHAHYVQHGVDSMMLVPLYKERHPSDPEIRKWEIKVFGRSLPVPRAKL